MKINNNTLAGAFQFILFLVLFYINMVMCLSL